MNNDVDDANDTMTYILADMMEVAVNTSENVELNHDSGLLITRYLRLSVRHLHQQSRRNLFLGDVYLDWILLTFKSYFWIVLLTRLPDVIKTK